MSIFRIKDIDDIFLLFCDVIDDLFIIKKLNGHYNKLINHNDLFQLWNKLWTSTCSYRVANMAIYMLRCSVSRNLNFGYQNHSGFRSKIEFSN